MSDGALLIGLDVGTTHAKAAAFRRDGTRVGFATRAMPARESVNGRARFDPDQVWAVACDALREVSGALGRSPVAAFGVTSMAESGLLIDAKTGSPRTQLIPWFDMGAGRAAARLAAESDGPARFQATGLHINHKAGMAKILAVAQERGRSVLEGARWLSTADYVAFRLTGALRTDPSLAARTHAYRLFERTWDFAWVEAAGLRPDLFPEVVASGQIVGRAGDGTAAQCVLPHGTPVAIAGHDHVVAALAAGALNPGRALDSMGTAESLIGGMSQRCLTEADYQSGLTFGPQPGGPGLHWMGALAAAGGSIEWLRTLLADPYVSYEHLVSLLARAAPGPSPILYFPYLAGAQAPEPDAGARGAFVGLTASHTASDLALAVIQGASYEMERVREAAERLTEPITELAAVGGGTRIRRWLQTKADVSGRPIVVPAHTEAALLGAALLAGTGAGLFSSVAEAVNGVLREGETVVQPDLVDHRAHRRLLDGPYRALQQPLRAASVALAAALREDEA